MAVTTDEAWGKGVRKPKIPGIADILYEWSLRKVTLAQPKINSNFAGSPSSLTFGHPARRLRPQVVEEVEVVAPRRGERQRDVAVGHRHQLSHGRHRHREGGEGPALPHVEVTWVTDVGRSLSKLKSEEVAIIDSCFNEGQ